MFHRGLRWRHCNPTGMRLGVEVHLILLKIILQLRKICSTQLPLFTWYNIERKPVFMYNPIGFSLWMIAYGGVGQFGPLLQCVWCMEVLYILDGICFFCFYFIDTICQCQGCQLEIFRWLHWNFSNLWYELVLVNLN